MKNFLIICVMALLISCEAKEKRCQIIHKDTTLQLYNDILIELVEDNFSLRYLPDGNQILSIYDNTKNLSRIKKMKVFAHNNLWGNTSEFKTIYLNDTSKIIRSSPFSSSYSRTDSILADYRTTTVKVLSSPLPQNINALKLQSCTFNIKSIADCNLKTLDSEIGTISFSNVFFSDDKQRAVLSCSFYCGGLCGRGMLIQIIKVDNHWKITRKTTTWIS